MLKTRRPFFSTYLRLIPFVRSYSSCSWKGNPISHLQEPPRPKKIPSTVSAHGKTWEDPYGWMSNTHEPDLLNYLNQENSYAEACMRDTRDLQTRLFAEMKNRMRPKVSSPPERWGPWIYYQYIPEGKEYPILCRRWGSQNGLIKTILNYMRGFEKEEILLDWNEIAEEFGYVHIGTCRVSPDHNFLAYTQDPTGSELFMLQIKDLRTGCIVPKSAVEGVVSLAWSQDSTSLLYTVCDEIQRPYRVLCTKLESDVADGLLFTESDSGCCVDITSTKDGKYITINSNSRTSSEVYVIDSTNLHGGSQLVRKRMQGVQYFLEHHHGYFYILTNAPMEDTHFNAGDYHLARCRAENLPLTSWQGIGGVFPNEFGEDVPYFVRAVGNLISLDSKVECHLDWYKAFISYHSCIKDIVFPGANDSFQDMDIFYGHLVLFSHNKGVPVICSINMPIEINCKHPMNFEDLNPWFFPLPPNSCSVVPGSNHDFMASIYRVVVSSPVIPDMIVDYDMAKQKFTIVQQEEVVGLTSILGSKSFTCSVHGDLSDRKICHDKNLRNIEEFQSWTDLSEEFCCERREVISHDGVRVPMTILYSKKARQNGQSPGLLQGYGAYGEVLDKSWCAERISLLDRGWVVAYADVRGGGGGDLSWHSAGVKSNKLNSIYDFVACGSYLVNEGYVCKGQLCAIGFSAGGILVGAAMNMYPDLFRAAILKVPFLDVCKTLLDPSLPLTILDYEEFGNPSIQNEFKSIYEYSPYDNILSGVCYPSMLITTSLHDSRVGVWEAAKWTAKIREITCPECSRFIILKTNMSGGHFSEGGRFKQCVEAAFEYSFLIKALGFSDENVKENEIHPA